MKIIGKRERDPKLQELFDQGKSVWSISKANTVDNCLYEAWCTYKKHMTGASGIYGLMGGKIHDKLEAIINGSATESELSQVLNEELSDLDMLGIDFPKDMRGGTSIRDSWIADINQFCRTFQKPKGEFSTEEFILYKVDENRYIQGYIDLIKHNKDGTVSIYDWKTSTDFTAEDLLHHGRQLVFYALAEEQLGNTVKEVAWIMLKYCEVQFMGKARSNSKEKTLLTKVLKRGKLVSELKPYIESDLYEIGLDDIEIEIILNEAVQANVIPQEVAGKYTVKPYVRRYPITDELRAETINYINRMADLFENKSEDESEWPHRNFYRTNKKGEQKKDVFYCNTLCNHRKTCPHIRKHNDLKALSKLEDDDLF